MSFLFHLVCCGCEANQKYDITHPETGKMLYKAIEGYLSFMLLCG